VALLPPAAEQEGRKGKLRTGHVLLIVAAFILVAGVGAAWAVDRSQENQIAKGIQVAGVDIGGMSTTQAARVLRSDVVAPLERPVTVRFGGDSYKLTPQRLKMHSDIEGMVAEAKDRSRDASFPARLWRYASGGEVKANIEPRVTYSHGAVEAFVAELKKKIDRPAQDATVTATPSSVNPTPSKPGVELNDKTLVENIESSLQDPVGERSMHATVTHVKPDVTTAELAGQYPSYITVDRGNFQLNFFRNLKLVKSYPIAVGMIGLETPAGLYHIQDKAVNAAWHVPNSAWAGSLAGQTIPGGSPENPIKARWMGIFNGAGIHGTDEVGSLGSAASHGCIRMAIPDVIALYDQVSVGTPVYIGN
jgi:lipoprotein-anchoring transpeptidase ErfK/SrfK